MSRTEDNAVDRSRLKVVLESAPPRYLTATEAARASGFSCQAVYRAIGRGDLRASVVCSRLRIHPDHFLAWMVGDRAAGSFPSQPGRPRTSPAPDGLRSLLAKQRSSAA